MSKAKPSINCEPGELISWCGDNSYLWADMLVDVLATQPMSALFDKENLKIFLQGWFANAIETSKNIAIQKQAKTREQVSYASYTSSWCLPYSYGEPATVITNAVAATTTMSDSYIVLNMKDWLNDSNPCLAGPTTDATIMAIDDKRCMPEYRKAEPPPSDGVVDDEMENAITAVARRIADEVDKEFTAEVLSVIEDGKKPVLNGSLVTKFNPETYYDTKASWDAYAPNTPATKSEWPSICPKCGGPAYVGASIVDCYAKCDK